MENFLAIRVNIYSAINPNEIFIYFFTGWADSASD